MIEVAIVSASWWPAPQYACLSPAVENWGDQRKVDDLRTCINIGHASKHGESDQLSVAPGAQLVVLHQDLVFFFCPRLLSFQHLFPQRTTGYGYFTILPISRSTFGSLSLLLLLPQLIQCFSSFIPAKVLFSLVRITKGPLESTGHVRLFGKWFDKGTNVFQPVLSRTSRRKVSSS